MVSFQTVTSALLWCFTVQLQLLSQDWPKEILETDEGRPLLDANGNSIARGLSVRMWVFSFKSYLINKCFKGYSCW